MWAPEGRSRRWRRLATGLAGPTVLLVTLAGCAGLRGGADLTAEWERLCAVGGCLAGGQDWSPERTEGGVFHEEAWRRFLQRGPETTVRFLVSRLPSREPTGLHVCPWHHATEGEAAAYAAQQVLQRNWYECAPGAPALRMYAAVRQQGGAPLMPRLLRDEEARAELERCFLEQLEQGQARRPPVAPDAPGGGSSTPR